MFREFSGQIILLTISVAIMLIGPGFSISVSYSSSDGSAAVSRPQTRESYVLDDFHVPKFVWSSVSFGPFLPQPKAA